MQCPEAHLFCAPCVEAYAGTQLGLQRSALLCMHASGCARPFPAAQLSRALPAASLALWERLTQADEIARAGLTGLAECPFCEWKCVLDEEDGEGAGEGAAGRFWCGNRDKCGVISCRKCKKSDHAPKTCDGALYFSLTRRSVKMMAGVVAVVVAVVSKPRRAGVCL